MSSFRSPRSPADWTLALAVAAIACLIAMLTITLVTGVSQETFEIVRAPDIYADGLAAHTGALRLLFGIDSAFLVIYAAAFVGLGHHIVTPGNRWFVALGVGALLLTALLDMTEDHHILAMVYGVEAGVRPSAAEIVFEHTLSQVKFNVSYLGLFLVGLAMPRQAWAGRALALLLTVGTLIQSVWLYAAPVAMLPAGNFGRWIGFLVGFALTIQVVRARGGGASATGAPA
jgi:hypothetical protein